MLQLSRACSKFSERGCAREWPRSVFPASSSLHLQESELNLLSRRPTILEGLYSGLGDTTGLAALQLESKMKLLVEAPAAVEDALASLLDHADPVLQVRTHDVSNGY